MSSPALRLASLALAVVALTALVVTAGCEGCTTPNTLEPLDVKEGCQPLLAGSHADCLLPYPSDFFRVPDDTMPTGFRVELSSEAKLVTDAGDSADVNDWKKTDGFSRTPPILAVLGQELSADGLVGIFDDYGATTSAASRTLILDAETGAFVPHFTDLDPRATDPLRQALILRPVVGLEERRRYIVALQGITGPDGKAVPAPEGFRRLLDGTTAQDPALDALAARYNDEIFAPLTEAGVSPEGLQLAWDFTTGSDASVLDDMLRARELALEALAAVPPVITIDFVDDDNPEPDLWRKVYGKIEGPLVMEDPYPGAKLARDDAGRVRLNGRVSFDFTAIVPACVRDSYEPGLVVEFGHGFFGTRDEVESGATRRILERTCSVGFAVNWWGMSTEDVGVVIGALGEQVWSTLAFSERVPQGMVNWLALTAAIDGALKTDPAFTRSLEPGAPGVVEDPNSPGTTNAGAPLYDAERIHFVGISQGHILGGVLSAVSPRISRSVLHVGGAAFTQMMFRAKPFEPFLGVLRLAVEDPLEQQKVTASFQRHFDPIDPALYARFLVEDELPFGPPGGASERRVLVQLGIGDTSVPNFASLLHGRMIGVPAVGPQPVPLFGFDEVDGPHEGSGLATFDLGVDPSFAALAEPPAEETIVHGSLRGRDAVLEQMRGFLQDGVIVHPCDGPCVLE